VTERCTGNVIPELAPIELQDQSGWARTRVRLKKNKKKIFRWTPGNSPKKPLFVVEKREGRF